MKKEPINSKDTRIISKFILFPKRLYLPNSCIKKTKWLETANIKQIASPFFSSCGTMMFCEKFKWVDSFWV